MSVVFSSSSEFCLEDSDDESPNHLYCNSGPPNNVLIQLFSQISKNGVLELDWKRPASTVPSEMSNATEQSNLYSNSNPVHKMDAFKPEPSPFDFSDEVTEENHNLPLRPRTAMRPKPQQDVKTSNQIDKILSDFIRKGDTQQPRQLLIPTPKIDTSKATSQPTSQQVNVSHVVVTQHGGVLGVPIAIQQKPIDPNAPNHQLQTFVQQFGTANQQQIRQGIPANHFILDQRQTLEQFFQQPTSQLAGQVPGANQRAPTHVVHLIQHPQLQQFIQARPAQPNQQGLPNLLQQHPCMTQGQPGAAQLQVSLAQLQQAHVQVATPQSQSSTSSQ